MSSSPGAHKALDCVRSRRQRLLGCDRIVAMHHKTLYRTSTAPLNPLVIRQQP